MRRLWSLLLLLALGTPAGAAFTTFESGQVRPLALSPDGTRLFAVNTPDDRLEIFSVAPGGLTHLGSVPVGLEPVAVAARTNTEVWVVNHLSDSVSIVDVGSTPPRVKRTLLVGDEPRDIVFAGPGGNRAFITTAHRGQNSPVDPQLTTEGKGRADVFVFDALDLGTSLAGDPLKVVTLFGDTPRALAVAPGGGTVYAAVFESGNETATVNEGAVCNGGASAPPCTNAGGTHSPGGLPAPNTNYQGILGPETGLIVKFNETSSHWEDRLGRNWDTTVKFDLPDKDVFAINANGNPPKEAGFYAHVGTVIFNMVVNPASGKVYVSNTDARNEVRFEGPGTFGGSTVRGHLHEARITVIGNGTVTPRHLNKHINYSVVPSPAGVADASLAIPTGMAVTSNGATLYVAAFGSSKIGVFSTAQLENDTFTPSAASHITVSGGGPSGLVLDEANGRLYVMTRFDNSISVVETGTASETAHLALHNPEPPSVVAGRPFLYNAAYTSSNGEASCASCHIFGDFDSLAWDLGNPDDVVLSELNPFRVSDPIAMSFPNFHPLKGPMTTQSLRGMANNGPMHWRGDRSGANDPGGNALDEDAAFKRFNVAFGGLLGRSGPLDPMEMQAFTDFILQVRYPPNPIADLNGFLNGDQQAGENFFMFSIPSDVFNNCNGCHVDNPAGGNFGTDGFSSFEFEPQLFKIPHLRNLYQKVGMFGMPAVSFFNPGDNGNKGPQVRGFGFIHDGSVDTLFRFHSSTVFDQANPAGFPIPNPGGFPNGPPGDPLRRQVEQFMLAFPTGLAPIVGQQVTIGATNSSDRLARLNLINQDALNAQCDVVAKGNVGGEQRGWVRIANNVYQSDRGAEPVVTVGQLRSLAATPGQEITFMAVPIGEGFRVGIDRDGDGWYDQDEIDLGTDPADPLSFPALPTTTSTSTTIGPSTTSTVPDFVLRGKVHLRDDVTPPIDLRKRKFSFSTANRTGDPYFVFAPSPFTADNPVNVGATLSVYNSSAAPGSPTDSVIIPLPAANWAIRNGTSFSYVYTDLTPGAPISQVKLRYKHLIIKGSGAGFGYTLDEATQGSVVVKLTIGPEPAFFHFCSDMPAQLSGNPPSAAKHDKPGVFDGVAKEPPAECAPPKGP